MSSPAVAWPESLRPYVVADDDAKVRLRPFEPVENTAMMIVLAACLVTLTCVGPFIGSGVIAFVFCFAISAFLIIALANDRLRWCEIERMHSGWRVLHGVGRWMKDERVFDDSDVLTVILVSHAGFVNYGGRAHYYLRVEFVNQGFGGTRALSIGRRLVYPKQTLTDLGSLIQSKPMTDQDTEAVSEALSAT
jgi:hypothetical protein